MITLRLVELALRQEHVDDGTRTDFETGLRRFERAVGRNHRLLARLDFADTGDDRAEIQARIAHKRAFLLLQRVLGSVAVVDGLAHARLG